ncbi:lytic murein transglycosylase [Kribbella sp. NPDC050124]|uniref:lytic transglycosylase domain-containing protein n=1 Tax=Kribbella sp. NPDC050124 TaxID=3364114 RepID=UPI003799A5E4
MRVPVVRRHPGRHRRVSTDQSRWKLAGAVAAVVTLGGLAFAPLSDPSATVRFTTVDPFIEDEVLAEYVEPEQLEAVPAGPGRVAKPVQMVLAGAPVIKTLGESGIPDVALRAYKQAEARLAVSDPDCGVPWTLLAAIGRVESNHGRFGGAQLRADGSATRRIRGIPLDGRPNVALIRDTDNGALDGDTTYDRAVGPMQFIPSTWRSVNADANRDGFADPNNLFDAAQGAAQYLCTGTSNLTDPARAAKAVRRYNNADSYVRVVLELARMYQSGRIAALPSTGDLLPDEPTDQRAANPWPARGWPTNPQPEAPWDAAAQPTEPTAPPQAAIRPRPTAPPPTSPVAQRPAAPEPSTAIPSKPPSAQPTPPKPPQTQPPNPTRPSEPNPTTPPSPSAPNTTRPSAPKPSDPSTTRPSDPKPSEPTTTRPSTPTPSESSTTTRPSEPKPSVPKPSEQKPSAPKATEPEPSDSEPAGSPTPEPSADKGSADTSPAPSADSTPAQRPTTAAVGWAPAMRQVVGQVLTRPACPTPKPERPSNPCPDDTGKPPSPQDPKNRKPCTPQNACKPPSSPRPSTETDR